MKRSKYPVEHVTESGRRCVAIDGKGNPAKDHEHATGWAMLEEDRPNHKKRRRKRKTIEVEQGSPKEGHGLPGKTNGVETSKVGSRA